MYKQATPIVPEQYEPKPNMSQIAIQSPLELQASFMHL